MVNLKLEERVYFAELASSPVNEIGSAMLESFEDLLRKIDTSQADALILYSGLNSGFCAGADLRELYKRLNETSEEKRREGIRDFIFRIHAVMDALDQLPLATISVIHGVCFGGGLELALTTDIRIAEVSARFCFPELRLGIIPGFGGIPRLCRDVGNGFVRDLLLTGRSVNAKRAYECGLVNHVVPSGEGLKMARQMAAQISKFDAEARRSAKHFIKKLPKEALRVEKETFLRLFENQNVVEALKRFVESDDVRPYLP